MANYAAALGFDLVIVASLNIHDGLGDISEKAFASFFDGLEEVHVAALLEFGQVFVACLVVDQDDGVYRHW
jgi:hypothetical protein